MGHFSIAIYILKKIQKYGKEWRGKTFFEVGTGHAPLLPVAFWLCGAEKIITVDLNPYMRNEMISDMLFFIDTEEMKNIFGDFLDKNRFNMLLKYSKSKKLSKDDILKMCNIDYIAPGDAAKTSLKDNSVNYHISNAVYEHIPLKIINNILMEGNRIITQDGLFINCIDYGDHFSYMDNTISVINFLQYSDNEWSKYAENRYMYMNRARHDDFIELFKDVGHEFIEIEPYVNKKVLDILEKKELKLDDKFREKDKNILSTTSSWFITKKK
jgi:hypothetical protein